MNNEEIEKLVKQKIEKDEKLGHQTGGSGHISHVSYTIGRINTKNIGNGKLEILYKYTLIVETEFTCYPDNPPYEYHYKGKLVIDINKLNLSEIN